MRKMKIVHVTQFFHPTRGYQENHLSILQAKAGHDVVIICTDDLTLWGVVEDEIKRMDKDFEKKYNIIIIRLKKLYEFSTRIFVRGLNDVLDQNRPELLTIHAVSLPMSLQAMKWGAKNNIRIIVDDHMVEAGSFNKSAKYFYSVFRVLFPLYLKMFNIKVDKWIAVSGETKEFMLKNYGITDNIEIVPLGFDNNTVYRDIAGGKEWLLKNKLPLDTDYILYIGKFDHMKDPIDLIEPFKVFQKEHPEFKLLMVGDPSDEYAKNLNVKIENLQIKHDVYIVKSVPNDEMRKVFSIAEMVIWPHGSSMAMLEAMVCECPVLAPNIDVNQERLSEGRGVMFIENDIHDLVDKMNYILENKEKIIPNAKRWVDTFAWENLSDRFL